MNITKEMTIGEISTSLGIAKPNITPLLDALYERCLLERCRSELDAIEYADDRLAQLEAKEKTQLSSFILYLQRSMAHSDSHMSYKFLAE